MRRIEIYVKIVNDARRRGKSMQGKKVSWKIRPFEYSCFVIRSCCGVCGCKVNMDSAQRIKLQRESA